MNKDIFSIKKLTQTLEEEYGNPLPDRVKAMLNIAFEHHRGQFRDSRAQKQSVPFIVHPVGTAKLAIKYFPYVKGYIHDDLDTVMCVALAHDLLEDTRVESALLETVAGSKVYDYVNLLTKPPAGIMGRSVDERNREFLDRIIEAGPTAVFVKICDSIHNMSRPKTTPYKLFRKAVAKARNQYLYLLEQCNLGEEFKRTYNDAIKEAEAKSAELEKFIVQGTPPSSLEEAITICINASAGKILELHDISEILAHIFQTEHTTIWRCSDNNSNDLSLVSSALYEGDLKKLSIPNLAILPQVFENTNNNRSPFNLLEPNCLRVFTIPMQINPSITFLAILCFNTKGQSSWINIETAMIITQFLTHRLIVSEADRGSRLATTAANLGIKIDVDLATQLGIQSADLNKLTRWLIRCRQAISIIENLVKLFLLSEVSRPYVQDLIKVESRVKAVNSILRKYINRPNLSWPNFESMEDIAGVRIICPSLSTLHDLETYLTGKRVAASGVKIHPTIGNPYRNYIKEPTMDGYRALHLVLEVETFIKDEGTRSIPCEVQLRTIFQDAWADISHTTIYRSKQKSNDLRSKLREMGETLKRCDELAEELIKDQ